MDHQFSGSGMMVPRRWTCPSTWLKAKEQAVGLGRVSSVLGMPRDSGEQSRLPVPSSLAPSLVHFLLRRSMRRLHIHHL
ncbi:hypothetical protein PR002_g6489 [Phytophthora rubi]|uniref:Uncharacterized protein n=1 Tax=Phytophthora rubi TaxID=129364 RepID=A0A6A3N1P7_9STRA|nr:hypothetical protein PR002_g6489 [Phytophthora rubi]